VLEEAGTTVRVLECIAATTDVQRRLVKLFYRCVPQAHRFRPSAEIDEAGFFPADALPPGLDPTVVPLVTEVIRS
jgi:hypothetical protein